MSPPEIKPAFELQAFTVPLDRLVPTRTLAKYFLGSATFRALIASIREVGLIEPLSVFPRGDGCFLIEDGHARVEAMRELGLAEALCLRALQDEGYTYNQKVSRISPIEANRMILKALESGVPEARLAQVLDVSVSTVRGNKKLLVDICPEAIALLKDKHVARETLGLLKKVKPARQVEMAEIMVAAGTYSSTYARALLVTSPKEQLVDPDTPKKARNVDPKELARVEREMRVQEKDFRLLDETYNEQVMALTLARAYLRSLLENASVVAYLSEHRPEYVPELRRVAETEAL